MWRYLVGLIAGVLIMAGGALWLRSSATARPSLPDAPIEALSADGDTAPAPPAASEKTREEKRFSRYDHDRNGAVSRDEFLASRRRAFAKLDVNGDGKLSFDEYAVKTEKRFATADHDGSGALDAPEFATTRIIRKTRAAPRCAPDNKDEG
jgi:hypothetical protein